MQIAIAVFLTGLRACSGHLRDPLPAQGCSAEVQEVSWCWRVRTNTLGLGYGSASRMPHGSETLGLIPSTAQTRSSDSNLQSQHSGGPEVQGHSQLTSDFEGSLGCMRSCLKTYRTERSRASLKSPYLELLFFPLLSFSQVCFIPPSFSLSFSLQSEGTRYSTIWLCPFSSLQVL